MRKIERQLFESIVNHDIAVIKETLDKGANPNVFKSKIERITPLMVAARVNNVAVIKLLIDYGANRDLEDFIGRDAYEYAETFNSKAAMVALMSYIENPHQD